MPHRTESVAEAAAAAGRRWRFIAIGLAFLGASNLFNTYLVAQHRDAEAIPVVCVATVYNPALAEYAVKQGRDVQRRGLDRP
jgi:hypothetical protein